MKNGKRRRNLPCVFIERYSLYFQWKRSGGLCQQLRRSATSIPANIAEGHGRYYFQDNVRFCYNARGSLDETLSHLSFSHQIGYLSEDIYRKMEQDGEKLPQLINGYIGYLKRSKQGANEPGSNHAIHDSAEHDFISASESVSDNSSGTKRLIPNSE